MHPAYLAVDPLIIWFYRITGYTFVDFLIGTFVLGMTAVILGEFTISLAYLANRKHIEKQTEDVVRFQNLSVDAIEAQNKPAYSAANKMANEAFGKSFFMQIALSTAFLWPIPLALGWMQYRFHDVEFRLLFTDITVGYFAVFIALYVAAYLIFKRVKPVIPYFKWINAKLDESNRRTGKMRSFSDLLPKKKDRREIAKS
jgi:hypothetical protein